MQADEAIRYLLGTLPADDTTPYTRTQQAIAALAPLADAFAEATDEDVDDDAPHPYDVRRDAMALALRYSELLIHSDQVAPSVSSLIGYADSFQTALAASPPTDA